jgi:hypothetical protein
VATISLTDKYSQLIEEITSDHEQVIKNVNKFVNSATQRIPALCNYLKNRETEDGIKLYNEEIRKKVYQDCSEFWEKETVRKNFPDWLIADFTEIDDFIPKGYMPYGNSGMMIPVEEHKFFDQNLEQTVIAMKRNFRQLIKEAESSTEVQKAFSDYCYANEALKNVKWYIENVGKQFKMRLIDPITLEGKQLRKPISVYNLSFPVHDDLKPYLDSIREKKDLYEKQLDNMVESMYKYPIMSIEDAQYIDKCFTTLLIEAYQSVNFKSSQTLEEMFETEKLTATMTEKQAGKRSDTKTLVCKTCLKKFNAEKNDDLPIMEIDRGSSTGFRCPTCLGMEVIKRGLTKDIVIQRRPFLEQVSAHIKQYPAMGVFTRFGGSVKKVLTGTRKALASGMLKDNHFGSSNNSFSKI